MTHTLIRPNIPEGAESDDRESHGPRPPHAKRRRAAGVVLATVLMAATGYLAYQAKPGNESSSAADDSSEVAEHQRHLRLAPNGDDSFDRAESLRMQRMAPNDPFLEAEYRRQSRLAPDGADRIDTSHAEAEARRMERLEVDPRDN